MLRLLVVDDEPDILAALAEGLQVVGAPDVDVVTATSGEGARDILASDPSIGVVVSDVRMPGMSGLELLAWMRRAGHPATRIVMSAYSLRGLLSYEFEQAAPAAVFTKPVDLKALARIASGQAQNAVAVA